MKNKWELVLGSFAVISCFLWILSGCQRDSRGPGANQTISVKGSDTMVHLMSSWAEDFMKVNPDTEVSVTGGGSGTGIAALLNGTTNICAASRKIKQKEEALAQQKGIKLNRIVVAKDGIAVVVNPQSAIAELSLEQIKKIFTGAYTNWNQVGGADEKINLLSRESNSGTYVFFQKRVLNKEDYATAAKLMPASSSIIQTVSADKGAIGYVGLGYALAAKQGVKILSIKVKADTPGILPSLKTVQDGTYPISRPLQLYTNGKPQGFVKQFIDFSLSPQGQKIVQQTGYVPVN